MQSQLHKHHASTEWQRVLYTESLCSREGAREVERERKDVECDSSEKDRERNRERESEKRYKDPKDRSKKAERANTNRVIAA